MADVVSLLEFPEIILNRDNNKDAVESIEKTNKMIANLYDHLKLRVMDNQPRPFIYAFSALVTQEVV